MNTKDLNILFKPNLQGIKPGTRYWLHRFQRRTSRVSMEPFLIGRRRQTRKGSKPGANKTVNGALFMMAKQKLPSAGPMGMQPPYHDSTIPFSVQPAMPGPAGTGALAPRPKAKLTRIDAVRIAKARITRRKSLRKQRQAQMG